MTNIKKSKFMYISTNNYEQKVPVYFPIEPQGPYNLYVVPNVTITDYFTQYLSRSNMYLNNLEEELEQDLTGKVASLVFTDENDVRLAYVRAFITSHRNPKELYLQVLARKEYNTPDENSNQSLSLHVDYIKEKLIVNGEKRL